MIPKGIIASIMLIIGTLPPTWGSIANAAMRRARVMPLGAMGPEDLTRTRIRGTGCVWMTAEGRSIRFAASDDRAVVKLRGAYRWLRPSTDAGEMFPFTYDRWVGDGMTVRITVADKPSQRNLKAPDATMEIRIDGKSSMHAGRLDCGT